MAEFLLNVLASVIGAFVAFVLLYFLIACSLFKWPW